MLHSTGLACCATYNRANRSITPTGWKDFAHMTDLEAGIHSFIDFSNNKEDVIFFKEISPETPPTPRPPPNVLN